MLDLQHLASSTKADVQVFTGEGTGVAKAWQKPRGVSMLYILALGRGGAGGNGAVGAASAAAGGGGGASGSQTTLLIPAIFLPDTLYIHASTSLSNTSVAIYPSTGSPTSRDVVVMAYAGNNGGNASGATAGAAGTLPVAVTAADMPLYGMGRTNILGGQAGVIGSVSATGTSVTLPTTGLIVTGGASGGGLANTGGGISRAGGNITGAGVFPTLEGGVLGGTGFPPGNGSAGIRPIPNLNYFYGGSGGASSHPDATGAGLVGGYGGDGAPGCGGGGGGGALTGSTQGLGGKGGPGLVVIISW